MDRKEFPERICLPILQRHGLGRRCDPHPPQGLRLRAGSRHFAPHVAPRVAPEVANSFGRRFAPPPLFASILPRSSIRSSQHEGHDEREKTGNPYIYTHQARVQRLRGLGLEVQREPLSTRQKQAQHFAVTILTPRFTIVPSQQSLTTTRRKLR